MKFNDKVNTFLLSWSGGVVRIGKEFLNGGDYKETASDFIKRHYAFEEGDVLFKPTFTKAVVFRNSFDMALSYFIGGKISEDDGFALKPWNQIDVVQFNTNEALKAIMGIMNLKPVGSKTKIKIAFTFILAEFLNEFKIKIHHSSPI